MRLLVSCGCALVLAVAPCGAQTPEQLAQIKKFCMKQFTNSDRTDWEMVEYCIRKQIEALQKVEGRH